MKKNEKGYSGKNERISGDLLGYFLLHNFISVLLFFIITISIGIYVDKYVTDGYTWMEVLGYVISSDFWQLTVFQIFPISLLSSLMGRITAFYLIKIYCSYYGNRSIKRWSELNRGINRMGVKFVITALITSFFFTIGLVALLSVYVFDEQTLLPLIVVYTALKLGIFFFTRWLVGSKL